MRSHTVLPLWLLWLTQGQALMIPPRSDTSINVRQQLKRDDDPEVLEFLTTYAEEDIIPVTETVKISTKPVATGTALVLPSLSDVEPHTEGFVITTVDSPAITRPPLLEVSIPTPTSLLQPVKTVTENAEVSGGLVKMATSNIFAAAVDTKAPLAMFERKPNHPQPRIGITMNAPIQTNKFYANLFLDKQLGPVYTFPYSVTWAGGVGPAASWGLSISHIEAKQRVFGDVRHNNAAGYYINPVGIQSMIISAKELGKNTVLTTDSLEDFSARVSLSKDSISAPAVQFPLVQGMVFVTALFNGAVPQIQTGVYFRTMTRVAKDPKTGVRKFTFVLEDGTTWRLYAHSTKGDALDLTVTNNGLAVAKKPFYGTIQVAKDTKQSKSEACLDYGAGVYPTGVTLGGSVSGVQGTYTFRFKRAGHKSGKVLMFALPHHVSSFDAFTTNLIKDYTLQTTTKGVAQCIIGDSWTLVEPSMPVNLGFLPWDNAKAKGVGLSAKAKAAIKPIAQLEISQDMLAQSNLDSMYFAGKALAKFGSIVYVINNMIGDKALAQAGLNKLKEAFARFGSNKQTHPLVYDKSWGGVVSSASYKFDNPGLDFGNTYYNDHHFHYGYHILAAAMIGSMDSTWLAANKAYVNTLVRDIANPTKSDKYFPTWRSFDWYHGHSWAHGLFHAWDGKNQESSSEDMMSLYALKMWGQVIKDTNLVARTNLQLAVLTRSMQQYYLYSSDNKVQPSNFIGNKVAGILFENKIDHTTFFGSSIEEIQGIHMIPVLPPSNLARSSKFVKEEWDAFFSNGRIDKIDNAWKGVIYANYATIQPKAAYDFFVSSKFNTKWIDGGASRTWYLAYAAALAGI